MGEIHFENVFQSKSSFYHFLANGHGKRLLSDVVHRYRKVFRAGSNFECPEKPIHFPTPYKSNFRFHGFLVQLRKILPVTMKSCIV